jgi:hypothetical protein
MSGFSWPEIFVLLGLSLVGGIAILPYSFGLAGNRLSQAKLPQPVLALISLLQTALLMALAVGVGLLAARPVGLGAPFIQAALAGEFRWDQLLRVLPISLGLALLSFVLMALFERYVFASHVPEVLQTSDVNLQAWKRFLAAFYGGFDEEILTRLFLVSGLVWLLGLIWHGTGGLPAGGAFWTAILLAAVLFGLGHLPATRSLTPLTSMIILRAVVLNGIAGIAFGWLYWRYGLEAAMFAHFCADILLHLIGPRFTNRLYHRTNRSTLAS